MPSHTDFKLPGLSVYPNALVSLIVSIVFAYSRRANRRRLEDHFHSFWNLVLGHLICGEVYLFLAPQMSIYYTDEEDAPNPNLSRETKEGKEEECRPDFTIMSVRLRNVTEDNSSDKYPMFPDDFLLWNEMTVFETATPRVLFELKRPPSRHIESLKTFELDLDRNFRAATRGVFDQAMVAFQRKEYRAMESLILIAAVGEWWQFRVVKRGECEKAQRDLLKSLLDDVEEDEEDEEDGEDGEDGEDREDDGEDEEKRTQDAQNPTTLRRKPMSLFHELHSMERIRTNVEDCKPPTGTFTDPILFGSPQSNQCFYWIHSELKKLVPPPQELNDPPNFDDDEDELGMKPGEPID